jgi:hypothetical protein
MPPEPITLEVAVMAITPRDGQAAVVGAFRRYRFDLRVYREHIPNPLPGLRMPVPRAIVAQPYVVEQTFATVRPGQVDCVIFDAMSSYGEGHGHPPVGFHLSRTESRPVLSRARH